LNADLAARGQGARITLNDFIVRAAGLALRTVPAANRRRVGEAVEAAPAVDIALVVAASSGPRTTVLRDADRKGLAVLSEEIRSRVEQARAGEAVGPEDSAASLLVTSFARYGIESAFPMLPRDQVCVLGVGTVLEQPIVRGGALAVGWTLSLTLGFDPDALGGAVAAELLGALRGQLEDPLGMML
jgi:pyruvate dehydrogenase E2 component (dihydrolipoamide acetyltransferase)